MNGNWQKMVGNRQNMGGNRQNMNGNRQKVTSHLAENGGEGSEVQDFWIPMDIINTFQANPDVEKRMIGWKYYTRQEMIDYYGAAKGQQKWATAFRISGSPWTPSTPRLQ